ncbi:hypothetical protein D8B26_006574 [Coccidioides posadasii str. Silveira]|uniref:Uncharacterized protein n=2 Tax=Coccidioides posadasii TaxID=199306 RepID=E9CU05_COCPS|nr:hypothetical protein CPC735_027060 [Coccidioides posadasii C735 delta SOWgp]EER27370.1 hypothetical protein CPC735_027060 [Coccidioides posadasii C735 delta SOWgp]EFW23041.1 conserved hypothetical protein [Coccidioides posadasii str. Silveira]QVM11935.1 hypothetical protein D8B26_006574 [Coccidioides posadasii str. Silveira]|eukprot:XP_003069515.1 hypothetical protein CPC735_027060 [Coccidioides posadasii C735 delta SOWgp]
MAYYEPQGWQAPVRQGSWEQPAPPSRSGTSSTAQRDDSPAFASQFDEVDRAIDNLVKSGKLFNSMPRRESVPLMMGRPYDYDGRMIGGMGPPRHHSISDYDNLRPHSASNLQGFYAAQRFQGRPSEAEQMMQAKRRLAAQRERDLRNYHQEQQYNRSLLAEMSGNKSDRSMSPAAMSEESRRELIARQHRALYGNDSSSFFPNGSLGDDGQPSGTANTTASGARGPSPRGVDPFGGLGQAHAQPGSENSGQTPAGAPAAQSTVVQQPRSRANSTSSPSSNANQASYGIFDSNQQSTSTSSATGASTDISTSHPDNNNKSATSAVGPIGSRPVPVTSQAPNPALNKRSTTPLPSPLSYGFSPSEVVGSTGPNTTSNGNEKVAPNAAPSTHTGTAGASSTGKKEPGNVGLPWGNGSGVWRSKGSLGVQASVWG